MRLTNRRVPLTAFLAGLILLVGILAFAPKAWAEVETDTADTAADLEITAIDDLVGRNLGMLNGGAFDTILMANVDGINQKDLLYFNTNAETVGALQAGKVDAMITDEPIGQLAVSTNEGLGIIPERIVDDRYAYVLPKGSPLTAQLNERLAAYQADGTIEQLKEKWLGADDAAKTMPEKGWDAPNGTLVVAASTDNEPINYLVDNEPCGLCVELLEMMARDLGYDVTYRTTNSGSLLAEVQSGKADVAAYSFSITEERKQVVDMTEPYYEGGLVAVVRTTGGTTDSDVGFFEGLAASFERTFVTEGRWQLILSGLGVTMLISVSSGVLGLALGFVFVLLRRKNPNGPVEKFIRLFESLLGGLPVVVVLMVFYYVVFGSFKISGIIVSILVFTLIFGASAGSIMWNAIHSMDPGQNEAGRALGFGDRDTFFLVILPQAARQFAPLLLSQFVSLVKDTSVVGFVAVQDLTRVGDLIRARTMEAFFPLVAIAVIYFAICRLMTRLLERLIVRLEPKDGPRTIKGVEL